MDCDWKIKARGRWFSQPAMTTFWTRTLTIGDEELESTKCESGNFPAP